MVVHVGDLSDSLDLVWPTPGDKVVTVTVSTPGGTTSASLAIRIAEAPPPEQRILAPLIGR
jgi:hypothetical protein